MDRPTEARMERLATEMFNLLKEWLAKQGNPEEVFTDHVEGSQSLRFRTENTIRIIQGEIPCTSRN